MWSNYLKIAVRTVRRSVSYTLINVAGLTLGLACALVIFAMVSHHLSFDDFHHDAGRIYRFVTESHRDQVNYAPSVPPAFAKAFRQDYAYGQQVARICTLTEQLISAGEDDDVKRFKEEVSFAEPGFFHIFNFPTVSGKGGDLLNKPNTALVSRRMARKYFGNESPVGKAMQFENRIEFVITGVLEDIPDNTDLRSEIYFSYSTMPQYNAWYDADDAWGGITSDIQSFVLLQPGVTPGEVEAVLPEYVRKHRAESKNVHHYRLQRLDDIHFNPRYGGRISKGVILILALTGFFLILTACLNFINLATAQVISRAREVGVRKALGSARGQLFWQFTTETAAIVVMATLLAVGVAYTLLPSVNELFDSRLVLDFSDPRPAAFLATLVLTVTFLSGSYPAMVLSRFRPVLALKGRQSGDGSSINTRRILITAQFTISQVLLLGLIVVMYQMWRFRNSDLGFDKEAVVMIPAGSRDARMNTLKLQFSKIPQVEHVSVCFAAPVSDNRWGTMFTFDGRSETEDFSISFRGADEHYLSTFGLDLVAGRNLTPSDTAREFIVNETLVHKLGLSSPAEILGRTISILNSSVKGPVVGVVKDFHDQSLKADISPIFMTTSRDQYNAYAVKINMVNANAALTALGEAWSAMYPEQIFEYGFLDDQIASFYQAEETMTKIIQVTSFIALFIGCMGLFGLVSFMAVQKTREIGIRKVLGGSVVHILWLFGREFSRLVLIAFLMAAPIGWIVMSRWLENYAHRITISWWIFAAELAIIFIVVVLTVGYHSVRAALMNPVNSLRTE